MLLKLPVRKQALNHNHVQLTGRLSDVRQRWTTDGSLALIALLIIHRPHLGPERAKIEDEQPIPLRAQGDVAEKLQQYAGEVVSIEGLLRRRYYSRDGEQRWGQVEIWVDQCHRLKIESHQER